MFLLKKIALLFRVPIGFEFIKAYQNILKEAFVTALRYVRVFVYPYHNVAHTLLVSRTALQIAKIENMSPRESLLLVIAALFHDTGFAACYRYNEDIGAHYARRFMEKFAFLTAEIEIVYEAIGDTRLNKRCPNSKNKISCALQDADLGYVGLTLEEFMRIQDLYCSEVAEVPDMPGHAQAREFLAGNPKPWYQFQYDFWNKHEFMTKGAKELFQRNKEKNVEYLRSLSEKN